MSEPVNTKGLTRIDCGGLLAPTSNPNPLRSMPVQFNFLKHEAARYEHPEGLSASIKNPNEMISLVKKSMGFLFYTLMF